MTASGARRRGRSWPAARGWSSTGTGTRSTSATRRTGSASSTTTGSPGAATTRSSGSPATSSAPAPRWPTSCPTPTSASCTRVRAGGRWSSSSPLPVEGGLEPDRGAYDRIFGALLRGPVRRRPAGRHRLPAASRQRRRGARRPLAGARRPRALRRRRRAARPARRLRAGGRSSRARLPQRLRRRRGAAARRRSCRAGCARRSGPATASTRTSRCRCRCARGPTPASSSPTARLRRHGRMRSCPRAPRPSCSYEHPHLGRWAAVTTNAHGDGRVTYVGTLPDRTLAVALARWLRPAPDAWEDRPETVTVTSARNPEGGTAALRVELVVGTDELGAAGGGARPAVRDRPPRVVRIWTWRRGISGCSWRAPRGEQRGGVTVRSASKPAGVGWRLALVVLCGMLAHGRRRLWWRR